MGLHTYELKTGGVGFYAKMKKEEAEHLGSMLHRVVNIAAYQREVYTHLDSSEPDGIRRSESDSWIMFGQVQPMTPELKGDIEKFLADNVAGRVITVADFPVLGANIRDFYEAHIYVHDESKTKGELQAQEAEIQKIEAERTAKREAEEKAEREKFGNLFNMPEGQKVVSLQFTVDKSDPMTDYFSPHVPHSPELALMTIGRRQPETEAIARQALSIATEVKGLNFTWSTEKYANGHGNYLQSESTTHPDGTRGTWEVKFSTGYRGKIYEHPNFGKAPAYAPSAPTSGEGVEVRRNEERNGIEVVFPSKPARDVINGLKGHGFRWSGRQGLWWIRYNASAWSFAMSLTGATKEEEPDSRPAGGIDPTDEPSQFERDLQEESVQEARDQVEMFESGTNF